MSMDIPTRFTKGVGTGAKGTPFGQFGYPSPTRYHQYFNDFDSLAEFNGITDTASWDVTAVGVNTFALADGDGGLALITNAAGIADSTYFQKKGESFLFEAGKQLWFAVRFMVSDVTQSEILAGLSITDTTPLDVTDGVFFHKADGVATPTFNVEKNNTGTVSAAMAALTAATMVELAFHYNGRSAIDYFVNGVRVGTSVTTNLPDDEELALTFGLQNGEAVAKTMTIDYIFAAKER